jgi:hypothetical protein
MRCMRALHEWIVLMRPLDDWVPVRRRRTDMYGPGCADYGGIRVGPHAVSS